jgi:hypothetical protein
MVNSLTIIQEKQRRRYQMLHKLWEAVGGKEYAEADFFGIAREMGLSEDEANEIYGYFTSEGLFGNRGVDGGVSLSHRAIVEIEQSITQPNRGTEHFPSTVIQNFNAPVGSVQTGSHSVAHVTQNFGSSASEVVNLIRELRQNLQALPPDERQEAIEVVDALEEEVQSPTPRKGRIKAFLGQLGTFTANTASSVLADTIAKSLGM